MPEGLSRAVWNKEYAHQIWPINYSACKIAHHQRFQVCLGMRVLAVCRWPCRCTHHAYLCLHDSTSRQHCNCVHATCRLCIQWAVQQIVRGDWQVWVFGDVEGRIFDLGSSLIKLGVDRFQFVSVRIVANLIPQFQNRLTIPIFITLKIKFLFEQPHSACRCQARPSLSRWCIDWNRCAFLAIHVQWSLSLTTTSGLSKVVLRQVSSPF